MAGTPIDEREIAGNVNQFERSSETQNSRTAHRPLREAMVLPRGEVPEHLTGLIDLSNYENAGHPPQQIVLSTAHALARNDGSRALHYVDPEGERHIHTIVPGAWLASLPAGMRALLEATLDIDATRWRGTTLQGGPDDPLRLSYSLPDPLQRGANETVQVQLCVAPPPPGADEERQALLRLTCTVRNAQGTTTATATLPPEPARWQVPDFDIDARVIPGHLDPWGVHALTTADRRRVRFEPQQDGNACLSFVMANPTAPFDICTRVHVAPADQGHVVVGIDLDMLPQATLQWMRSKVHGAPALPPEVVDALETALGNPSSMAAQCGVSGRSGDRYIAFSAELEVVLRDDQGNPLLDTRGSPRTAIQRWSLRADFHSFLGVMELGVLQHQGPDGVRCTTYPPDRPEDGFQNARAPREESLGSPPASTQSFASTSSRRTHLEAFGPEDAPDVGRLRTTSPKNTGLSTLLEESHIPELDEPDDDETHVPEAVPATPDDLAGLPPDGRVTQHAYRQLMARELGEAYAHAGVCGPISAAVVLRRNIPPGVVQQYVADPIAGSTVAELKRLLDEHGGMPTQDLHYQPGRGWTEPLVAAHLAAQMATGSWDSAVVCYAVDAESDHHVAIFRHHDRWLVHDAAGSTAQTQVLPAGQEAAWIARKLFASLPADQWFAREMHLLTAHSDDLPHAQTPTVSGWSTQGPSGGGTLVQDTSATVQDGGAAASTTGSSSVPGRVPQSYVSGIGLHFFSSPLRRELFDNAGLTALWKKQCPDQPLARMAQSLAMRTYSVRMQGQGLDERGEIVQYDNIEFVRGQRHTVLVGFQDAHRERVLDVCPLPENRRQGEVVTSIAATLSRRAPAIETTLELTSLEAVTSHQFIRRVNVRLGGLDKRMDFFRRDGLLDDWMEVSGQEAKYAPQCLAEAVFPLREEGTLVNNDPVIYRYDNVPFGGRDITVLVAFTDGTRREAIDACPANTDQARSQALAFLIENSAPRLRAVELNRFAQEMRSDNPRGS